METSLKTGFAQIFSCCPKNLSCPKFWGGLQPPSPPPPSPPGPYAYETAALRVSELESIDSFERYSTTSKSYAVLKVQYFKALVT